MNLHRLHSALEVATIAIEDGAVHHSRTEITWACWTCCNVFAVGGLCSTPSRCPGGMDRCGDKIADGSNEV